MKRKPPTSRCALCFSSPLDILFVQCPFSPQTSGKEVFAPWKSPPTLPVQGAWPWTPSRSWSCPGQPRGLTKDHPLPLGVGPWVKCGWNQTTFGGNNYFASSNLHPLHFRANMKCEPNCALGGTLSKTRLASCCGGILAGSTGKCWRAAPARYWPDTRQDPLARDTQRDTWRDPLASYSGILSGMLGGIHWRAALAGCSARSTGEPLWRYARQDPPASRSGGILGGIHWRAALAGYWAGSTGEQLWRDTRRDPLWRAAALAGYWVGAWC